MKPSSKRETILVVDDVPATVEALQRNLGSLGYAVLTASSVPDRDWIRRSRIGSPLG